MRLPRWKKEQKQRKERKRLSVISNTLLVISAILLVGIGWKVYGSLAKSIWDGKSRLTIALNSSSIFVASFDPSEKTLNFLAIPGNTYLETIHGYGFYKAESIYELGRLEGYDGEFFAGSLQEYLGVPVEGWVTVRLQKTPKGIEETEMKSFILETITKLIKNSNGTNLTRWDLIRLWWEIKGVRFDKINLIDLGETNAVEEITLPDGTPALKPDPLRLDQLVARLFSDRRIKEERVSIGVYNNTQYSGLAKKAARMINNIGGQVVEVGDWKVGSGKCEVRSERVNLKKYTTQRLIKIFDCQYGGGEMGESRVEIAVIIGEDYWRKLNQK